MFQGAAFIIENSNDPIQLKESTQFQLNWIKGCFLSSEAINKHEAKFSFICLLIVSEVKKADFPLKYLQVLAFFNSNGNIHVRNVTSGTLPSWK